MKEPELKNWMCAARTRTGGFCRRPKLHGRGRCRLHGGKAKRGTEAAAFRHGRYSLFAPEGLSRRLARHISDDETLCMIPEMNLLTARIAELLERTGSQEPRSAANNETWRELAELCERRSKLARTEWRRRVDLGHVITQEQDEIFKSCLIESIRKHVRDQTILSAIARDLGELLFDDE